MSVPTMLATPSQNPDPEQPAEMFKRCGGVLQQAPEDAAKVIEAVAGILVAGAGDKWNSGKNGE